MCIAVNAIQSGRGMRRSATTRRRDREVDGDGGISALLPVGDILEEVFCLGFETHSA